MRVGGVELEALVGGLCLAAAGRQRVAAVVEVAQQVLQVALEPGPVVPLEHAQLVRFESSRAAIDAFLAQALEAVAGVRQPLVAAAAARDGLRVMDESFMVIRQAAAVPNGRPQARAFLADFIEEAKRSGFVARVLEESGVVASLAPPGR